jgi:hypothetical protein
MLSLSNWLLIFIFSIKKNFDDFFFQKNEFQNHEYVFLQIYNIMFMFEKIETQCVCFSIMIVSRTLVSIA